MKDVRSSPNCFKSLLLYAALLIAAGFLAAASVSCSSSMSKGTKIPTYEQAKKEVLSKGPLVKPPVEKQYKFLQGGQARGVFEGETVQTVDSKDKTKKVPVKWGAVVIDAKKAAELQAIKVQRDLLLKKLEAAKLQRDANTIIYKAGLEKAREAAKRTWWERNKTTFALVTGGPIGMGLLVGLIYALTRGSGITVNTNAHVLPGVR
jgi:hypothetical protein